ncbi:hypothetical protein AMECASPLE_012115 [Ameca splendens]|uniref:Uncharacterized protein n=1 Tax=Ameca splendens TaxID=208324 RepID=A0ABV0ZAB3_9TELE
MQNNKKEVPSIIFTCLSFEGCLSPAIIGRKAGTSVDWWPVRHRDTQDRQLGTHTLIPKGNLGELINLTYVLGLCVEGRVPGENPRLQGEHANSLHEDLFL